MSGGEGSAELGSGETDPSNESLEGEAMEQQDGEQGEMNGESFDELKMPGSGDPSSDSIESVNAEEIARLRTEAKENYDRYIRSVAELENYKKRAIKERSDLIKYAGENLARDIVDVLDDIERAVGAESKGTLEDFLKGVSMIRDRFVSILDSHSIKAETGLGKSFDPVHQQALASVPTADHEPGLVIQEFKKAYYFKDKLLRHGQVVVSAAVPDQGEKD